MSGLFTLLAIGFSLVSIVILSVCYLFFLSGNNKKPLAIISTILFLSALAALQIEHLLVFSQQAAPLNQLHYRLLIFLIPPLFYFFCRFVVFANYQLTVVHTLHFFPLISAFFLPRIIAVPLAFLLGVAYCLWVTWWLFRLRNQRKRFKVEFFFFSFFVLFALGVLFVGFLATYIEDHWFYVFYANGIALAFALVTGALIIYPNLLNELTEVVRLGYRNSTLGNLDVNEIRGKLETLMRVDKIYQDESLKLSTTAELLGISAHQLSELINTEFGISFSQYLRRVRVERAKYLLKKEPDSSVLAIALETGFKSQSNFYAAFKEITGESPGQFRNSAS